MIIRDTYGKPDPKPVKAEKKAPTPLKQRVPIRKQSATQAEITERLAETYAEMDAKQVNGLKCAAYPDGDFYIIDHDHTIAQARCKQLHKPELIWDADNIEYSSRQAHMEWEGYKSGKFIQHANFQKRMAYLKLHDTEGFEKRMQVVAAFTVPIQTI